ncbi:hypothetical protein M5D96_012823 [Drosophila gunungcola]|uniref:Uncharacterized protein n=1 Tax=Drosophila gunungcola TaxID=103775 RepID=A0A9P9YDA8_9MUSC|nr:hypothetical protein M5D96_012823 [Drosophila gunungcola]
MCALSTRDSWERKRKAACDQHVQCETEL